MLVWTPQRIGWFLVIWTLLWPMYIVAIFHTLSVSVFIYAALWGYLPDNPITHTQFVIHPLLTLSMLPFSVPGFIIAYFVYRTILLQDTDRSHFVLVLVTIQIIQMVIIWLVLPCTISRSPVLCLPCPLTGLVAFPFLCKIERAGTLWKDKELE